MKRFELGAALVDFSAYHRSRANRICHAFGLPAISAAVLGALAHVPGYGVVDAALILLALTFVLDAMLNVRVAIGVAILGALLYAGARLLPWSALGGLFALGWILQLAGHRAFEKNAPAFTKNMVQLFVGPRWLVNRVVRALPDEPAP